MANYYKFEGKDDIMIIEQDSVLRAVEDFLRDCKYTVSAILLTGSSAPETEPDWYCDLSITVKDLEMQFRITRTEDPHWCE